ncbi:MAG: hypothetical protein P4L34_09460 [Paludibacter sp.]|nr:hypothetical protein [Paludibacter sp.]
MKSNFSIFALILVLTTSCVILPRQAEAQQTNVSFQVFYDQLSPYGQWINYADYGYVWLPDSGSDFVPYSTDGHWVLTDYGWTWASDYIWGWATFHYGRWGFDNSVGWYWVPDNVWGPAWVNWRQSDGYYGWEPMEPGVSLNEGFNNAFGGSNDHWLFVRNMDFERTDINQYYLNHSDRDRIGRNSIVINRTYNDYDRHATYVSGPTRESVQRATGRTIKPLTIQENNKPGQEINNGQLRIYRPQVDKNNSGERNAPRTVTNMQDIKRIPANNAPNHNQIDNRGSRPASQPANSTYPQNNNARPIQQQNINLQNNNAQPVQQNRTIKQPAGGRRIQTVEPPKATPTNVNRPVGQPTGVNQQNNNVQPGQQNRTVNQPNSDRRIQTIEPAKAAPTDVNRPVQQPNVTTPNNYNVRIQQQNVNRQNTDRQQPGNTPPANIQNNPQPVQNQRVNQSRNNRPVIQQKLVKQQVKKEQDKLPDNTDQGRK